MMINNRQEHRKTLFDKVLESRKLDLIDFNIHDLDLNAQETEKQIYENEN